MVFVSYYTRVIVQFVIFLLAKLIILRGHRSSPRITLKQGSHIIAANHRSGLDPFAIVSSLRIRDFFRLAPFSFMTANRFMRPLWLRPLAWSAGCFPARPGIGAYGVDKAVDDLKHGYTLVIFPEGKRTTAAPLPAKPGIDMIISRTVNVRLILAHIEWHGPMKIQYMRVSYPPEKTMPTSGDSILASIYSL